MTRDARHKQKTLIEKGHSVSGMSFVTENTGTFLYVATSEDVFMFTVSVRDKEVRSVLDTKGCTRGLAVSSGSFLGNETHFVTGQQDAVYCYNPEGRGQCYPFDGQKKLLHAFGGYITVITEDGINEQKDKVTIFDVQNKFIAIDFPFKHVLSVISEWGAIFLVTQDGRLKRINEKDTQAKLQILFNKSFYQDAIKIARNSKCDAESLVDIYRQYGDNLYEKGDLQGAIEQYSMTIGFLEPSYVIQKFLEASKIHNLTVYLQELHKVGRASKDHTTLLLNCYTKLKNKDKLDEFIMNKEGVVFNFDVDIAINVCRQAGYPDHAMQLAEKHKKHDDFLKIVIEKADYLKALDYIEGLSPKDADEQLRLHGSVLIQNASAKYTQILKKLIHDWDGQGYIKQEKGLKQMKKLGFADGGGRGLLGAIEMVISVNDDYQTEEQSIVDNQFNAEHYIHLFVNDAEAMVDFLEHLVSSGKTITSSVINTLLEYQLYIYKDTDDNLVKKEFERKIIELLKSDKNYSEDQALVLCQLNHFQPGLLFLYQKSKMYTQILKHYFSCGQAEEGVNTCRKFGDQDHQLWVTALENIAGADMTEMPANLFKEVLDNIEKYRLLSPLQVVTTLSNCPNATLGVVREYLLKIFVAEENAMKRDREVIDTYKEKSAKIREKLDKLNKAYEIRATKCSGSNRPLELPAVHFLCGHSFNEETYQGMMDDPDQDYCPICAKENKKIMDMLASQENKRNQHDQFHDHLEKSDDGFRY